MAKIIASLIASNVSDGDLLYSYFLRWWIFVLYFDFNVIYEFFLLNSHINNKQQS